MPGKKIGLVLIAVLALGACQKDQIAPVAPQGSSSEVQSVVENTLIGNRIWKDLDQNGIQALPGVEPGFPGLFVDLYTCAGVFVARDTTDAAGNYEFLGFAPGDYRILFHAPAGWTYTVRNAGNIVQDSDADPATGWTDCTTISANEYDLTWDAGLIEWRPEPATIGDRVWNDMDADGIQDGDEPGIEGITVHLLTCDGVMVAEDTTDAAGNYLFGDIAAGSYKLHFVVTGDWVVSPADQTDDALDSDAAADGSTICTTLDAGESDLTWDAGLYVPDHDGGCTRTIGYWKNHPEDIPALLPLWLGTAGGQKSVNVTTTAQAVNILKTQGGPNGIKKLYGQFLAAKLNFGAGADDDDVASVVAAADAFLASYNDGDWNALSQALKNQVLAWKDALDDYNNGVSGPGHCD